MATEIFQLPKGVWACVIILEKNPCFPFLVTKKIQLPSNGGVCRIVEEFSFGRPPHINCGNQIFLVTTKGN
jgi:hypothetical protein